MPDILIRNIDEKVFAQLKENAKRRGRSLQQELTEILRDAARDPYERANEVRERLAQYKSDFDGVEAIREDRER